jgi:hypothetical protein
MLRHEVRTSSLRLYVSPDAGYWTTPDAQMVLTWLDDSTVVMSDFRGQMTRRLWIELLRWLVESGVTTIHAERKPGHCLPCERPCFLGPNWRTVLVDDLTARKRDEATS